MKKAKIYLVTIGIGAITSLLLSWPDRRLQHITVPTTIPYSIYDKEINTNRTPSIKKNEDQSLLAMESRA